MDIQFLLWLQGIMESLPSFVTTFFEIVSKIAISEIPLAIGIAVIYWCFDKRLGQRVVMTFSISALLNNFIKLIVCAYRPWIRSPEIHPVEGALKEATGYSFPSGHTQTATAIFGTAGRYAFKRSHKVIGVLLWVFVALVAISRPSLRVHTPQDVIVALAESIAIIFFVDWLVDWIDGERNRDLVVLIVAAIAIVVMSLIVFLKPYPMDYDAAGNLLVDPAAMRIDYIKTFGMFVGVFLGWFLERRFINFELPKKGDVRQIAIRIGIGLVVLIGLILVAKLIQSLGVPAEIYHIVKNFFVLFSATFLSPLAFTTVERRMARREPTIRR